MPAPKNRVVRANLVSVDKKNGLGYFMREDMKLQFLASQSNFRGEKLGFLNGHMGQAIMIGEATGSTIKLATIEERQRFKHETTEDIANKIAMLQKRLESLKS